MAYTGPTFRGVDYSPTWPTWNQGEAAQTNDSDFANDAFASFWSDKFRAPLGGGGSAPQNNGTNYRNDLFAMQICGFNLVRLYNWNMARGTNPQSFPPSGPSPDHINFLDYAYSLGLQVVVPVSDWFLSDASSAWPPGSVPDSSYSFASAPAGMQSDLNLFVTSITDPRTGKIHAAVHSISVGNEGDIGQGISSPIVSPSSFLARTIWWIVNLRQKIAAIGPNVKFSATFSNGDQGIGIGCWFNCLINGVTQNQKTPTQPNGWSTFGTAVTGLKTADSSYASYYYNSTNIGQNGTGLTQALGLYDSGASPWPGGTMNVPLLFMEVFTNNRTMPPPVPPVDAQALAVLDQVTALEAYLKANKAQSPNSKTNLMGYNYFEFNDEPSQTKYTGLFRYHSAVTPANTGTTSVWYQSGPFANYTFNVHGLAPNPGPLSGPYKGLTLPAAVQAALPQVRLPGKLAAGTGSPGNWQAIFSPSKPPTAVLANMSVTGKGIPARTVVTNVANRQVTLTNHSSATSNPFPATSQNDLVLFFTS